MTKRKTLANPYDRYRAQAYDIVAKANQGRIPDLTAVLDELLTLGTATDVDALKRAAAMHAVETEDSLRTTPPPSSQQQTLPGWPDPSDLFWKLGDGERVRVDAASATDHFKHVQLIEQNERQIVDAAREVRDRYYRLVPHYAAGARTVPEAVAAYTKAAQQPAAMSAGD